MNPLPAAVAEAIGCRWGVETTRDRRQSRVWRVAIGGGAYAKQHATVGKYRRERDALRALGGCPFVPALVAHHDDIRLLVVEACPGDWPDDAQAWHRAGEALAELHRMPCAADPMALPDAIARRRDGWLARAEGVLPDGTRAALAARVDGAVFRGAARVFCHRDYAPRNWRVGADGVFRVFDFEHAGPDAAEVDLVRLYDGPLEGRPGREAAFFAGYGGRPDRARLAALLALHALGTATWGRLHGDRAYAARGDRLIERALASRAP